MDRLRMRLVRLRLHRVSNPGVNCVHLAGAQTELNRAGSYAATREYHVLSSPTGPFLPSFHLLTFQVLFLFFDFCTSVPLLSAIFNSANERPSHGKSDTAKSGQCCNAQLAVPLRVSKCSQDRPQDEGVGYPCSRCPWFYSKTPEASTAVEII